eukprot:13524013-Ditylum_brightwellii.AAC.1
MQDTKQQDNSLQIQHMAYHSKYMTTTQHTPTTPQHIHQPQHQAWIQTNYGLCTSSLQHNNNNNNTSLPKMVKTETRLQTKLSKAPA